MKKNWIELLLLVLCLVLGTSVRAYQVIPTEVTVGGNVRPDPAAALQVESITGGFLPPRMTTVQRDALPLPIPEGLIIYNTTDSQLQAYTLGTWGGVGGAGGIPAWLTGVQYKAGNVVHESNHIYLCLTDHTSNIFNDDYITNGYWTQLLDEPSSIGIHTDVTLTPLSPNEILQYNDITGVFENKLQNASYVETVSPYTVKDYFDLSINKSVSSDVVVSDDGGLNFSWTAGAVYDYANKLPVTTTLGSATCTDNNTTYLYWTAGNNLSTGLVKPTGNDVLVATINCQAGDIITITAEEPASKITASVNHGLAELIPAALYQGIELTEDADPTNVWDVSVTAGEYYLDGYKEVVFTARDTRTVPMTRHFKVGGVWTSDTSAEIDPTQWNDGTNLVPVSGTAYYKSCFYVAGDNLHWVYPTSAGTVTEAALGPCPDTVPGLADAMLIKELTLSGQATAFPLAVSALWVDARPKVLSFRKQSPSYHQLASYKAFANTTAYESVYGVSAAQFNAFGTMPQTTPPLLPDYPNGYLLYGGAEPNLGKNFKVEGLFRFKDLTSTAQHVIFGRTDNNRNFLLGLIPDTRNFYVGAPNDTSYAGIINTGTDLIADAFNTISLERSGDNYILTVNGNAYNFTYTDSSAPADEHTLRSIGEDTHLATIQFDGYVDTYSVTSTDYPTSNVSGQFSVSAVVSEGAIFYDTTDKVLKIYRDGQWNIFHGITEWVTLAKYVPGMYVSFNDGLYKCKVAHTAGTFSTDLANGNWIKISGGISNWSTGVSYKVGDVVIESNLLYQATIDHISGTFLTDLANGNWVQISDYSRASSIVYDDTGVSRTVEQALDFSLRNAKVSGFTFSDDGGLNFSWAAGEVYGFNNSYHSVNAGSAVCTDNSITYGWYDYGTNATDVQVSTVRPSVATTVPLFAVVCIGGDIVHFHEMSTSGETFNSVFESLSSVFKLVVTSGLQVSEDTDVTNVWDIHVDAGTWYEYMHKKYTSVAYDSRILSDLKRWYFDGTTWVSSLSAEIDPTQWNNAGTLSAVNPARFYTSCFYAGYGSGYHWSYPDAEYTDLQSAIDANCPDVANSGFTGLVPLTKLVLKGNDATFPAVGSSQWIDIRPIVYGGGGGGTSDHGSLTGLSDDDHLQYALLAGRSGGQSIIGGIDAGDNLVLQSTSNATRGVISFLDSVNLTDGLESSPSLSFTNDNTTGMFMPAIGALGFSTGGVAALALDSNQNALFSQLVTSRNITKDVIYFVDADTVPASEWNTANLVNNTFTDTDPSPISGSYSYKYTSAVGGLNEWVATPQITVDKKTQGQYAELRYVYLYDNTNTDERAFEVQFYDVTNSRVLSSTTVSIKTGVGKGVLKANIPANTTAVELRIVNVIDGVNSIYIDDIELNDSGFSTANLEVKETITYTGYTSVNASGYILHSTEMTNTGRDLVYVDNVTYPDHTRYTFKKSCEFIATANLSAAVAVSYSALILFDSAGNRKLTSYFDTSGTDYGQPKSLSGKAEIGDYLVYQIASGSLDTTTANNFSVTATATRDNVLIADKQQQAHFVGSASYDLSVDYNTTSTTYILPSLTLASSSVTGEVVQNTVNSPSITIPKAKIGTYKVEVRGMFGQDVAAYHSMALFDGVTYYSEQATYGAYTPNAVFFVENKTEGSLNLDFVIKTNGTAFFINSGPNLQMSVTYLPPVEEKEVVRTVALPQSEKQTYSARIDNNGTTASILSKDADFIQSVTRTGTGQVRVVYKSGVFTVPPSVVVTGYGGAETHLWDGAPADENGFDVITQNSAGSANVDVPLFIQVTKQGADAESGKVYVGSFKPKELMYVHTAVSDYNAGAAGSTTYVTMPLVSLSGDVFGSVATNQLTLKKGVYDIEVPVGAYNGTDWVSLQLYRTSGTAGQIEELPIVAKSLTTTTSFNTAKTTVNLIEDTTLEFRMKSIVASGTMFIGRISIERRQ